uniref:DNA polymerase epsilon subunit 3 n=1 Tax=Cacopsylla melanoneura TaxID=428564 RepID=A0A8D8PQ28_9HEMI
MAESLDDLNLPSVAILRLIKEALPEDSKLSISKDVKLAAGKATSLFILHLTTEALSIAQEKKRKVLSGPDVIEGVKQCGFEVFAETLQKKLDELNSKKKRGSTNKKDTSKNVSNVEEMEVEDEDEGEEEEAEAEEEEEKD